MTGERPPERMPGVLGAYLDAVRAVLAAHRGYVATAVVGSIASGDFALDHSDVDLITVFEAPLSRATKREITSALRHDVLPCPAHGLDLVGYARSEVRAPSPGLRYDFSIASGRDWADDIGFGGAYSGGLIDLAAARDFGRSLEPVDLPSLIGPMATQWIRTELARSLRWHLGRIHDRVHDPLGTNAVLNACRALHFLRSESLVSKTKGAKPFLAGRDGHLVARALRARRDSEPVRLPRDQVAAFVDRALDEFNQRGNPARA